MIPYRQNAQSGEKPMKIATEVREEVGIIKVTAMYAVAEKFGAGLMKETDLGFGPRIEYNIKKNVQAWGAILRGRVLNADDARELLLILYINRCGYEF